VAVAVDRVLRGDGSPGGGSGGVQLTEVPISPLYLQRFEGVIDDAQYRLLLADV